MSFIIVSAPSLLSKIFLNHPHIRRDMTELSGQKCGFCGENQSSLKEEELDIPHFGKVFVFSMECTACGYRKADIEPAEAKEPCKYTLEVTSDQDMNIKVIKSSEATVKIPHIITIEPGPASEGYITNIEGLLERVKSAIQQSIDLEDEDETAAKKAKNLIKKLNKVISGRESLKIILEDPSGHSAILSEKAQKGKM